MGMSYWGIVGYGVCIDDIDKYLDSEKVNKLVRELCPDENFEEDVFEDDTFYGDPYSNFGEFLCELDKKDIMTYDDDGNGRAFFMYTPRYPWEEKRNEPQNLEALTEYIVYILKKVCKPYSKLDKEVHYICTYGCG